MSLIKPFRGNFKTTQVFGNKLFINGIDVYAKYNLLGHNGWDIGMPVGTELISPMEGVVVEVDYDANGYGWYVKLENNVEGCLLAHFNRVDVKVGFVVEQGQHLGVSGNTGNSTGPHLHIGYYRIPRDRSNGFNGYIDPQPYFLAIGGSNMGDQVLNTYGLDDTNIASKQVVYDTWHDVTSGIYIKRAESDAIIKPLQENNNRLENDLKGLQERYNVGFAFLSELEKLGLKSIDDVKSIAEPYLEMSGAGFPDLESIKKALVLSNQTAATSVDQLKKLLEDYNLINNEVITLRQELIRVKAEYVAYDKNSTANKVCSIFQRIINALRSRKNIKTDNRILDGATQVVDAWDEFNKMIKGTN